MNRLIEHALRVFCVPGQVTAIQALKIGTVRARSQCLGDVPAAVQLGTQWDAAAPLGLYFIPNPVRPDLAGTSTFPKDEDITERHWLLIDCDPARPSGTSSSQAEAVAAWHVLDRCRGILDTAGLTNPVVGFSGNGWHLCYPVLLANDEPAKSLVAAVLNGLQSRCGDVVTKEEDGLLKGRKPTQEEQVEVKAGRLTAEQLAERIAPRFFSVPKVKIGTECHDAKRLWPLYGTWKRKGLSTAERPHRQTFLLEGEHDGQRYEPLPWDRAAGKRNAALLGQLLERWRFAEDSRRGRPQTDAGSYATAALRQELAAVAAAGVGDRNNQLNRSSFALGQLVAAGALARPEVEAALLEAGSAAGLAESEARATVRSGLNSGATQPRDLAALSSRNGHKNGTAGSRTLRLPAVPAEPLPETPAPRVQPFPLDILPPLLKRFVVEGSTALCCPPDYLAIPMLIGAASAIGASRALRLTSDWWVFPSIYAAIVAPPGSAKSPAAGRALAPVRHQQIVNLNNFKERKRAWGQEDAQARGESPKYCRTYTTSTTVEKLAPLLRDCPRGLLLHTDELIAWVASFNQYREGGKGTDQQVYMSIWDHQGFSIERKSHDDGLPITVQRPCLSVFGTIQPDVLSKLTSAGEQDGFLERILFAYPEPLREVRQWTWEGISTEARSAWHAISARLYSLSLVNAQEDGDDPWPRFLTFNAGAREAWESWYNGHQHERSKLPESMWAFHSKLESYCARLILLVQMLWYANRIDFAHDGTPEVDADAVECGARLTAYFLAHARRAYGRLELSKADQNIEKTVARLRSLGGSVSVRDVLQYKLCRPVTMSAATRLLEDLVDRCLGQVVSEKAENGRDVLRFQLHATGQSLASNTNSADSADAALTTQFSAIFVGTKGLAHSADSADAPGRNGI